MLFLGFHRSDMDVECLAHVGQVSVSNICLHSQGAQCLCFMGGVILNNEIVQHGEVLLEIIVFICTPIPDHPNVTQFKDIVVFTGLLVSLETSNIIICAQKFFLLTNFFSVNKGFLPLILNYWMMINYCDYWL